MPWQTPAVQTEDRSVTSTSELESLPSDIQAGESVVIKQPDTPYRPASWPNGGKFGEIDVSNIEIVCESTRARNGERIVKPQDGSDIGGLVFGFNNAVTDVHVRRWGFHGNSNNMDQSVTSLNGIEFRDATRWSLKGHDITRTSPRNQHSTGGSGVSVRDPASEFVVAHGRVIEPGDRGHEFGGAFGSIIGNYVRSSFDRAFSFNNTSHGSVDLGNSLSFVGNTAESIASGTFIKGAPDSNNNISTNIVIAGNSCDGAAGGIGGNSQYVAVGNQIKNLAPNANGIMAGFNTNTIAIGNYVEGGGQDGMLLKGGGIFAYNFIDNFGSNGVNIEGGSSVRRLMGNTIRNAGNVGVRLDTGGVQEFRQNRIMQTDVGFRETTSASDPSYYSGNVIIGATTPWDLQFVHYGSDNWPKPTVDAAPSSPVVGQELLATSSWDPDGDGNGEKVVYDGTDWQEIADMPNL